jgi:hypothetical protein
LEEFFWPDVSMFLGGSEEPKHTDFSTTEFRKICIEKSSHRAAGSAMRKVASVRNSQAFQKRALRRILGSGWAEMVQKKMVNLFP